jgi:hypothetical protein
LQQWKLMRPAAALLAVLLAAPAAASAQDRLSLQPAARAVGSDVRRARGPVVAVAPVTIDDDDGSLVELQRATERIAERLRPLEERLRTDDRLRRAGAVVGLGVVAMGALRGTAPLTAAGTQVLRFGLHDQLSAIERRTGFVVEPSIGHRRVAVTVNKTFH